MFNENYIFAKGERLSKDILNRKSNLDYERFEFLGDMLIKFFVGVDFCIQIIF